MSKEYFLFACLVAVIVEARLENPSTESDLVSKLRLLYVKNDDPEKERKEKLLADINSWLKELGADGDNFTVTKGNSIWCFFMCSSEQQLHQLREHFLSGLMTNILMKIFKLLADDDDVVMTHPLKWNSEDYIESMRRLYQLNTLGK